MTYYQQDFPPDEFQARRQAVMDRIGGAAVAVLAGAPATGAFDLFRQTNEFYYLSGIEVPHTYLLLDGRSRQTTLYLPPRDAKHEASEGAQLSCDVPELVRRLTGIENVAPLAQLAVDVAAARQLYVLHAPGETRQACRDVLRHAQKQAAADPWMPAVAREDHFRTRLAAAAPQADVHDLTPILDELRLIKSPRELALMRRAGELTAQAVREAMLRTRPGMFEYQLTAVADQIFVDGGATGAGYRAIVAGGTKNIWNNHYYRNRDRLTDGELVLMDYAPDLGCYTSDIGRMWPVGGRFSHVQRELYGFVVAYHEALLAVIRPGKTVAELTAEAAARIGPTWETWPWSKPAYRDAARKMIDSPVAFTHPVGMAVHDVGDYRASPLRPGLVFALDPQLWVHEEQLYIRVEDTVAVTESGVESFTSAAPSRVEEVEALMAE